MEVLMPLPPSTLAVISLETIPGSTNQTPSPQQDDLVPVVETVHREPSVHGNQGGGESSRRSSVSFALPISGSYFPSTSSTMPHTAYLSSPTGSATPGERPRPSPIEIPTGTHDNPLFSAYPHEGGLHRSSSKGKARAVVHSPYRSFNLSSPPRRRRRSLESDVDSDAESIRIPLSNLAVSDNSDHSPDSELGPGSKPAVSARRRAYSASEAHAVPDLKPDARGSLRSIKTKVLSSSNSFKSLRKRRASIGALSAADHYTPNHAPDFQNMVSETASRFDVRQDLPFSYEQPVDSDYTLQSVSARTTSRPLATPSIVPRRSSLAAAIEAHDLHRFRIPHAVVPTQDVKIVLPDDMVQPREPPARRSSLSFSDPMVLDVRKQIHGSMTPARLADDNTSIVSGTDVSPAQSPEPFSPSASQHPLSSATTSLSRSAKSGKEGTDENDAVLSAVRLQRSLEWEARQETQRKRLEKRKMILLELVETEVRYTEELKILVQIYLPQLTALPTVSKKTASLIGRNTTELLFFHTQFSMRMVDVLKEEGLTYEPQPEPFMAGKFDRVSRRLAALFVEDASGFAAYNEYCAGSIAAATLVRHITGRPDYDAYERRCQIITNHQPHIDLEHLLSEDVNLPLSMNRSRLHLRDFLILPIQRVCRYPLLLASLLGSAAAPSSPTSDQPAFEGDNFDVGVDVERALGAMRAVAEDADEARRIREAEIKSATVLERMETHPALTPTFLKSLGVCRLIGGLDVLHHHPVVAPLVPPVKVKYLAAFLYRGYLILAKVKKGKVYEAKHFLPLEVFELIDITEGEFRLLSAVKISLLRHFYAGFLPHSIRLTLRDHNFDLAASCEAEKDVWAGAICDARDESTVPPFELPASVSPFAPRARRGSIFGSTAGELEATSPPQIKRHSLDTHASEMTVEEPIAGEALAKTTLTPVASPIRTTFPPLTMSPSRTAFATSSRPASLLLRRASTTQRLIVDRGLVDVFSKACATARSKAQMEHTLFLPDVTRRTSLRDASVLRRRSSFVDSRSGSIDIVSVGEIKGSVLPLRSTRSLAGRKRSAQSLSRGPPSRSHSVCGESATEMEGDETAMSDFGTLIDIRERDWTRTNSLSSDSPVPSPSGRRSRSYVQPAEQRVLSSLAGRRTTSAYDLNDRSPTHTRTKSMPASPVAAKLPSFASETAQSGHDTPSPVYNLGRGLTNLPETSSPWQSLRRSMSFASRNSNRHSVISLDQWADAPPVPPIPAKHLSSNSLALDEPIALSSTPSTSSSALGLSADEDVLDMAAPKRRRSVRLFNSLARFTPI
ncbi:hypothetical protein P7C73_g4096, partial [Tremellales sp. Uapishka_1]